MQWNLKPNTHVNVNVVGNNMFDDDRVKRACFVYCADIRGCTACVLLIVSIQCLAEWEFEVKRDVDNNSLMMIMMMMKTPDFNTTDNILFKMLKF